MLTFHDFHLVTEALDRPVQWRWITQHAKRFAAQFKVQHPEQSDDVLVYEVDFIKSQFPVGGRETWAVTFQPATGGRTFLPKTWAILNKGGNYARLVFSTVLVIIKDFITRMRPEHLEFTAHPSEPSRVKLYDRLVQMAARLIPGYRGEIIGLGEYSLLREASANKPLPLLTLSPSEHLQPGYVDIDTFLGPPADPDLCKLAQSIADAADAKLLPMLAPNVTHLPVHTLVPTQSSVSIADVEHFMTQGRTLAPILVMLHTDGRYYICDGHHRACAARALQHDTIPALIYSP